ncbi:MAG: hypothetical protein A3K06_01550 [Candidatus Doudnabacteria bacterium RIFCSPHIGHO2_01_52_17]|uniref:VanZ-like domain-containing protein n=1 Tax=Candidatus Doudnabacteria bacterium RIFCSPHIGHO2_01_52_17 TaxID=1817820 RepID=A0A1F5NAK2_9BACT|nr:MAG: hypothetical protein A3K06_01550 [Candidatus Doudnabacteria bacterium RIFCSPHIGHO2_01_52_17]
MRSSLKFWILLAISAVMFFTPITSAERVGLGADKVVHIFLFAGLAIYGYRAYERKRYYLFPCLVFYTLVSEYIQGRYIPFRSFDAYDIVADTIGLFAGTVFIKIRNKNPKSESRNSKQSQNQAKV